MSEKKDKNLSNRIKGLRNKKALTQDELANKLGVTNKAVSKWESGKGNPDILTLPKIAKIFNVSVDYLLSGITPEKKVIVISKVEECAKNDDTSKLESLNIIREDASNNNLIQFVYEYRSKNVAKKLLMNAGIDTLDYMFFLNDTNNNKNEKVSPYKEMTLEDKIGFMYMWGYRTDTIDTIKKIVKKCTKDKKNNNNINYYLNEQNKININRAIVKADGIDKKYRDEWKKFEKNDSNGSIVDGSFHLEIAYDYNKKFLRKLLVEAEKHNELVDLKREEYDDEANKYVNERYSEYIYARESTLNKALKESDDFDFIREFNNLNKLHKGDYYIHERDIRVKEMEASSNYSADEIYVRSCIDERIVDVDKILKCKNRKLVIEALEGNAIHYCDYVYSLFIENKIDELADFALKNNFTNLARGINSCDINKCMKAAYECFWDCISFTLDYDFDNRNNDKIHFRASSKKRECIRERVNKKYYYLLDKKLHTCSNVEYQCEPYEMIKPNPVQYGKTLRNKRLEFITELKKEGE